MSFGRHLLAGVVRARRECAGWQAEATRLRAANAVLLAELEIAWKDLDSAADILSAVDCQKSADLLIESAVQVRAAIAAARGINTDAENADDVDPCGAADTMTADRMGVGVSHE